MVAAPCKCNVLKACTQTQVLQQHIILLTCRTKVEKHAAAASSIRNVASQDASVGVGLQGEEGAEQKPAVPLWDCNDGDTWHKRQRVCSTPSQMSRCGLLQQSCDCAADC